MDIVELVNRLEFVFLNYGYSLVFISSFIEISPIGWAIPGGTILAIAGFFSYNSRLSLMAILVFAWLGSWLTLLLAYYFGNKTGYSLVKFLKQEKNAKKAEGMLRRHGGVILTTSMLASLTRFWVAYVAGAQKYNFFKFLFYSATASLTWSSLMIIIGYFAGSERDNLEIAFTRLGIVFWFLLVLAIGTIYISSKKGFEEFKEGANGNTGN